MRKVTSSEKLVSQVGGQASFILACELAGYIKSRDSIGAISALIAADVGIRDAAMDSLGLGVDEPEPKVRIVMQKKRLRVASSPSCEPKTSSGHICWA